MNSSRSMIGGGHSEDKKALPHPENTPCGKLKIESATGKGSTFTVRLRVEK